MIYSFVTKPAELESLKGSRVFRAYNLLESKGSYKKLTAEERELVDSLFNELNRPETYMYGIYKLMGWIFDFSSFLNTYLVKDRYCGWREIKAFNKTCIRKNATSPSHILEIMEYRKKVA